MIFRIAHNYDFTAALSDNISFRNGIGSIIGAFGVKIRHYRSYNGLDGRVIENGHKIDTS